MSAAFESARRAASYLGSASAMAIAPSFPISLSPRFRSVRGVLKNPTEREMREFLGLWGSDEGTDCSIRKRAASCILPRKRFRDGFRALHPDLVVPQIQGGQRGVDLDVVGEQDGVRGRQPLMCKVCRLLVGLDAAERLDLAVLLGRAHDVGSGLANVVPEQVD